MDKSIIQVYKQDSKHGLNHIAFLSTNINIYGIGHTEQESIDNLIQKANEFKYDIGTKEHVFYGDMTLDKVVECELAHKKDELWGEYHDVSPQLLPTIHGDGKRLLYITPTMTRPNNYLMRVDSNLNIDSREDYEFFTGNEFLDEVVEEIMDEFGLDMYEDENDEECYREWPAYNAEGSNFYLCDIDYPDYYVPTDFFKYFSRV